MQSVFMRLSALRTSQSLYCRNPAKIPHFTRTSSCLPTVPSRSIRIHYSPQMTDIVYPDPNRPDLFYHFVNAPTPISKTAPAFALSFRRETPILADSRMIIGWLPAETYMTDSPDTPGMNHAHQTKQTSAGLRQFVGNPKFITLLQDTVKSALSHHRDEIWENGAKQLQEGWMHIHDQRNIPALGRIGDPDDIIGSVLVKDSKINADTYQAMPSYRVCTTDGVLQLTPGLAEYLDAALVTEMTTERSDHHSES